MNGRPPPRKDREPPWCPPDVRVDIGPELLREILESFARKPGLMLEVGAVREMAARARIRNLDETQVRSLDGNPPDAIKNALNYNFETLKQEAAFSRPQMLVNPLMSIDLIRMRIESLKVLTVGPRSESEIFSLLAAGFSPSRIRGLDLFSYSDFVDVGDMHDMPYPDGTFDVIILGWVLAYSTDNPKVAAEVRRVAAPGAFVAAGCQYVPYDREEMRRMDGDAFMDPTRFYELNDILKLWDGEIGRVLFSHGIHPAMRKHPGDIMTVFQFKR